MIHPPICELSKHDPVPKSYPRLSMMRPGKIGIRSGMIRLKCTICKRDILTFYKLGEEDKL